VTSVEAAPSSESEDALAALKAVSTCADSAALADLIQSVGQRSANSCVRRCSISRESDMAEAVARQVHCFGFMHFIRELHTRRKEGLGASFDSFIPTMCSSNHSKIQEHNYAARLWHLRLLCPKAIRMSSTQLFLDFGAFYSTMCRAAAAGDIGNGRRTSSRSRGAGRQFDVGLQGDDVSDYSVTQWSHPITADGEPLTGAKTVASIQDSSDSDDD